MRLLHAFLGDERGASAAEFVLVLPILILFVFGVLDTGWYAWSLGLNQKAAQMGARIAVVTNPVASDLAQNMVGVTCGGVTLQQGQPIPAGCLPAKTCRFTSASACSCSGGAAPFAATSCSFADFDRFARVMESVNPAIQRSNITVTYNGSGLGYAGDPNSKGIEIAPHVTVTVAGMQYNPLMGILMTGISMPSASNTLTMEDGDGVKSF